MTDNEHLDAWADTDDGYTVILNQAVLRCMWCDYMAIARTRREAVALYEHEHERPIIARAEAAHQLHRELLQRIEGTAT